MSFALSKNVDSFKVFLERKSRMTNRWDPHYHSPRFGPLDIALDTVNAIPLRKQSKAIFSGITPLSGGDAYTDDPSGIAFIRSGDFTEDGTINEDALLRLKPDIHQNLMFRSQLKTNDILFAIVGATIGKVGIFTGRYDANINQAICAVRLDGAMSPHFLHAFFLTNLGQQQIGRVKRPVARANINLEEIGALRVPLLSEAVQMTVVDALKKAFALKASTEQKASKLLASIDDLLLSELGIPSVPEPPSTLEKRVFERKFSEVSGRRFDPHYHHPRFARLIGLLESVPHFPLRELVSFSHEQWDQKSIFKDTFPYIEIGAVNLELGRLTEATITPVSEAANRAKMLVRPGDMLVSLTRPTRRAVCFTPEEFEVAVASNGFCVVRTRKKPGLSLRYLFHVLRSCLCTEQFDQRSSGGNYPAITEEQLSNVLIPWVDTTKQNRIAQILDEQYARAGELYTQAHADLEQAKREIEAMILGEPTEPTAN